jgi:hypothetical protein
MAFNFSNMHLPIHPRILSLSLAGVPWSLISLSLYSMPSGRGKTSFNFRKRDQRDLIFRQWWEESLGAGEEREVELILLSAYHVLCISHVISSNLPQ